MKKKSVIIIICAVIIVVLVVLGIIFYPKYKENKEYKALLNKISVINDYLEKEEYDKKDPVDYVNEQVTSNDRIEIENKINSYLNSVLTINQDCHSSIDYKITKEIVLLNIVDKDKRKDFLKELFDNNEKLIKCQNDIEKAKNDNANIKFKNENLNAKYQELYKMINIKLVENKITNSLKSNSEITKIIEFLNTNNNWKVEDGKIVFTKRNGFNEYEKLNYKDLDYELIKDVTGPVISASDITITKGSSINIKDKVSCVDAVDGKVECQIDGKYDVNKVGSYSIKITATDESKNSSNKTIKLIVKEKVISNKPYYIEVIRNQNVVIVYGLDSNGNYTKIVKTFICSVGKSTSQTPTGTFKTSDKASWGWLVGNLYGQYYTRITGSILFHSVPYTKKAKNTLEWDEYNKLGIGASKGCVRMTVRDVKWIYDNCPRGTTVKIYDGNLPSGVVKPTAPKISGDSPNKGWDPTDPDKNNPWKK